MIVIHTKTLCNASNRNQQELADKIHIHLTHLSKMENGHLLPSIDIVQRLMKVFAVSADNLLNDNENAVVEHQNHELNEQLMLINQLDEDEKNALIKIIDTMLTKKNSKTSSRKMSLRYKAKTRMNRAFCF